MNFGQFLWGANGLALIASLVFGYRSGESGPNPELKVRPTTIFALISLLAFVSGVIWLNLGYDLSEVVGLLMQIGGIFLAAAALGIGRWVYERRERDFWAKSGTEVPNDHKPSG